MSIKILRTGLVAVLMAGAALACGGGVQDAVTVDFADICAEDDRWITADGVLAVGDEVSCETIGDSQSCHILLQNPDDSSDTVTITLDVGDQPNQMNDIPDNYSDEDLVVHDKDGNDVGAGDLVSVTGTASNNEEGFACRVWTRQVIAK
jgi:hypothetical protein